MINAVTIVGRLGRDPEIKTAASGITIAKFAVAVTEVRGKGEEKKENTHWIDCTAFGGVADAISKYVKKASKVTVQGRLSQDKWETESGEKRSKLGVIVENIEFMSNGETKTATAKTESNDDVGFE